MYIPSGKPETSSAEQVPLIQTTGTTYLPNDLQPQQWALTKINAVQAWDISQGSPTIKVAIVDNAVSTTHEDLASVIWTNPGEVPNNFLDDDLNGYTDDVNGYDVANYDPDANPPASTGANSPWVHGTHCAGIAGAASDNGIGIASIGFNISIIPVKASLDATGGNTLERAYEGVDYAVAAGADVVSMSWGSGGNSAYGSLSGTSMACPMAAGLAGLIMSAVPNLTPQQVKTALEDGCENIDLLNPQYVGQMGAGRINAYNSLLSLGLTSIGDQLEGQANNFQFYPNPVNDRLYIQTLESDFEVTIFNIQGQLRGTWKVNDLTTGIDLSQFEPGAYLVRIIKGNNTTVKKILKF